MKKKKKISKVKKKIRDTRMVGKREPSNYIFWKDMLKDGLIDQFIHRGSIEQKATIKGILRYLKVDNSEMFDEVNGQNLLKQLKGK